MVQVDQSVCADRNGLDKKNTRRKSGSKKEKKRKKRKRDDKLESEISTETTSPAIDPQLKQPKDLSASPPQKKKKHKKKKRKKTNPSENLNGDSDSHHDDDARASSNDNLEGQMVGDTMVLIDRARGSVFSAFERLGNGDRKQVGVVDQNGDAQLFAADDAENANKPRTSTAQDDGDGEGKVDTLIDFPFETDPDDHCESPLEAYKDITPLLKVVGSKASIYDPYYCNGRVVQNLKDLGFDNVYNRKEDCYKVWESETCPSFDLLLTNPPYSGDHMEQLMRFLTSSSFGSRPWFLLLPQFVHKKDYYQKMTSKIRPFYIVPKKRYIYLPPKSFRESKKSDTHKKSSPFVSMWYIWGGSQQANEKLLAAAQRGCSSTCDVARSKSALRDLRRKKR